MTDLVSILKTVELFHGMSDRQLQRIAELAEKRTCAAEEVVFHRGDKGDALYVISNGQVEVQVQRNGTSNPALYLGAGQTVGEMALIDAAPRSATIVAVDHDTQLYRISVTDFMALCTSETGIGFTLMRNIAQDLSFKLRHQDFDTGDNPA